MVETSQNDYPIFIPSFSNILVKLMSCVEPKLASKFILICGDSLT